MCLPLLASPFKRAPSLGESAYNGVHIKDVLQMSSGVRWTEDYSDPTAEIHDYGAVMAGNKSFETFLAGMKREFEPGTCCVYNSVDTQGLGLLLVKATGRSISDYMTLFTQLGLIELPQLS